MMVPPRAWGNAHDSMVAWATRQIRQDGSTTALYSVLVAFIRYGTPSEYEALEKQLAREDTFFCQRFFFYRDQTFLENSVPAAYSRHDHGNMMLFRSQSSPRRLVIGFCGRDDDLSMPTAVHLQYLAGEADLLMVLGRTDLFFNRDTRDFATTVDQLVEQVKRDVIADRYDEVATFGISGGSLLSLVSGVLLDAAYVVAFSGLMNRGANPTTRLRARQATAILRRPRKGHGFAVYAGDNAADVDHASRLARVARFELVPVPGTDDHNIIGHLHRVGELRAMYEKTGILKARPA